MATRNDGRAALALRALQKADQIDPPITLSGSLDEAKRCMLARALRAEAQTALGRELGLVCTGDDEGDGNYSHGGETCPVHEWLVPDDAEEVESRLAELTAGLVQSPRPRT